MLERPRQDWDDALADYVTTEHTAKDVKVTEGSGCCLPLIALAILVIVAMMGG